VSSAGTEVWRREIDGSVSDSASQVVFDSSGDAVVVGTVDSDFVVWRLDGSTGADLWTQ